MTDARNELTRLSGKDSSTWSWGRIHTLTLENQSFGQSGIGVIAGLFNRGPLHLGGGESIVDATAWNADEGYEVTAVPSMRMVIDLADLDRSRWINLTGASGHTSSPNYWDQAKLWRDGETLAMHWRRDSIERDAKHTLTLVPHT
jgi:penicillin G amidase